MFTGSKAPACPSCHTAAQVKLESDSDASKTKVWRCEGCQVRWEASLTPRSER